MSNKIKTKRNKIRIIYQSILLICLIALGMSVVYPHMGRFQKAFQETLKTPFPTQIQSAIPAKSIQVSLIDKSAPSIILKKVSSLSGEELELTITSDKVLQENETLDNLIYTEEEGVFTYKIRLVNREYGHKEIEIKFENIYGVSTYADFLTFKNGGALVLLSPLPNSVLVSRSSADGLLAPVSKSYYLSSGFEPTNLVDLQTLDIPVISAGQRLRKDAASSLQLMYLDMTSDGIDMAVSSTYRSYETQKYTFSYWLDHNSGNLAATDTISARPGHSEHQLGTTVDIVSKETNYKLTKNFAETKSAIWLAENSYKYGYVLSYPEGAEEITGYTFEPWHFRYIGKENALLYKRSGLTLIEYLENLN